MHAADTARRYHHFLRQRDGEADFGRHTLSHREAFFARLAADPVRSGIPVDREAYLRNLERRRPEPGLGRHMLWLLAAAKANRAERFAVGLAELYGRVTETSDPVRLHLQLQETYHTRILADVVALFGLPVPARPPASFERTAIAWIVTAPERLVLPLVGASEMIGCVVFRALRDHGIALAADEPAVAARVRLLLDEILADELGHAAYAATRLGAAGRALMRTLYRALGWLFLAQLPELGELVGRREVATRLHSFDLVAEAAELPGRAFAIADRADAPTAVT
jgi:hypothetical protein